MSDYNTNPLSNFEEVVVYKECKHNHALSLGKVGFDGCQDFLKQGESVNAEDVFLCACCGCHRNFHRQQIIYIPIPQTQTDKVVDTTSLHADPLQSRTRKKRTSFTLEMKNKLMMFANTIGWRMRKDKKEEINDFCFEIGITRLNFMRWINNNRYRAKENVQVPKN